jgi:hypothetical protein
VETHKTAISLVSTKEAALLFDEVVPLMLALEVLDGANKDFEADLDAVAALVHILPQRFFSNDDFSERLQQLNSLSLGGMLSIVPTETPRTNGVVYSSDPPTLIKLQQSFAAFVEDFGLNGVPIITPSSTVQPDEAGDIALVLRNLSVIDVEHTSWKQIAEFRRDTEARQKLRRLRLFAYENYNGKSQSFIEDDLQVRLYEYDESIRRWGFETKQAVLSSVLRSKGLSGALGGALVATLFGAPAAAVATAAGGAALEIGRIALEITRRKFLLSNSLQDNPVSYVAELRTRFTPQKDSE